MTFSFNNLIEIAHVNKNGVARYVKEGLKSHFGLDASDIKISLDKDENMVELEEIGGNSLFMVAMLESIETGNGIIIEMLNREYEGQNYEFDVYVKDKNSVYIIRK